VGLSAGLKHFALLERAKIGARAKKYAASISVAFASITLGTSLHRLWKRFNSKVLRFKYKA